MADATLERLVASPIADDSDELSAVASTRELRVRRIARFAAASLVALSAMVLLVAGSTRRSQSFTLGMDRAARPVTSGELVGPDTRAGETVYVDDVAVGVVPNVLTVKCGVASVRIGKTGAVRSIDIPCGGRVTL